MPGEKEFSNVGANKRHTRRKFKENVGNNVCQSFKVVVIMLGCCCSGNFRLRTLIQGKK